MAEGQRMTVGDVVAKTMDGRLEDFVKEAVALVARELMDGEISAEIGAALGEVAPESRLTHRNGYRPRAWETRVGEIELLIPKKRSGSSHFPSFLEPRRCSEQAIVSVVLEAYVNGVSTRRSTGSTRPTHTGTSRARRSYWRWPPRGSSRPGRSRSLQRPRTGERT